MGRRWACDFCVPRTAASSRPGFEGSHPSRAIDASSRRCRSSPIGCCVNSRRRTTGIVWQSSPSRWPKTAPGLGVARYARLRDSPETAESAVAVIDEMQRKGLGRLLCTTLIEAARERGIHRFRFSILAENEAGKLLLHSLDEHATARIADDGA
jgi:hypothetical protein